MSPEEWLASQKPKAAPPMSPEEWLASQKPESTTRKVGQQIGNVVGGLVRGAGSIGATILAPRDALEGFIARQMGAPELAPQDRRTAMDAGLSQMGVQTDSLGFKGGKLAGEVAGTAGAGGVVANGLTRLLPAGQGAGLIQAIRSGGLSAPGANLLTRAIGGSISGAATAGLANPEDAGMGAVFGGALPVAVKGVGVAGDLVRRGTAGLVKNTVGLTSGVGGEAVGAAYNAGRTGGTSFLDNMRGNVPLTDVLDEAKAALSQMRMQRAAEYRQGMTGVSADKTVIDFAPIDSAVASLKSMGNYKGQVINKNASGAVDEISGLVNQWKNLDPAEFHTPEGLDALKQAISDIRDTTQFGTAARKAADTAYNAVKNEITKQAPSYAKVMKNYTAATETLQEVERALSLGNKATLRASMVRAVALASWNRRSPTIVLSLALRNRASRLAALIVHPCTWEHSRRPWRVRGTCSGRLLVLERGRVSTRPLSADCCTCSTSPARSAVRREMRKARATSCCFVFGGCPVT